MCTDVNSRGYTGGRCGTWRVVSSTDYSSMIMMSCADISHKHQEYQSTQLVLSYIDQATGLHNRQVSMYSTKEIMICNIPGTTATASSSRVHQ